jgi:Ca2+/Na+ antiporter
MQNLKNVIILLLILCLIYIFFVSENSEKYKRKINNINKKKVELKTEILKLKKNIVKIRKEKGIIIEKYKFELEKKAKNGIQKPKIKIVYKDRYITINTPKSKIWEFSLTLHNDFETYVKLDKIETKKHDKILKKCLKLNKKSEQIIEIQNKNIKRLKKAKKKIVIIAILTAIAGIIALK